MIRFFDKGERFDLPCDRPEYEARDIRAAWIVNDRIVGVGYADPPGENNEHSRLAALVWLFSNMRYALPDDLTDDHDLTEDQCEAHREEAIEALREYEEANEIPAYYKGRW